MQFLIGDLRLLMPTPPRSRCSADKKDGGGSVASTGAVVQWRVLNLAARILQNPPETTARQ